MQALGRDFKGGVASSKSGQFACGARILAMKIVVRAAFAAASLLPSAAFALTDPITTGPVSVTLQNVATVNTGTYGTPQDIAAAPNDPSNLFVSTRNGDILDLKNGVLQSTPYLNMAAAGVNIYTGGEGGLLGLAFSPSFSGGSGHFYTVEAEPFSTTGPAADFSSPEMFPTTSVNPNNQLVLREWTAASGTVDASSRVMMRIDHPESNHQGGSLRFGPDGNLYMGLGDGGGGNDFNGSASSTTDGHNNAIGNGQDTTVPFGKILRINPNPAAGSQFLTSANGQYSIPKNNPFVTGGATGSLKEIYAYGLRNPYRIAFDSATGKLLAADVGQGNREEVDVIANGGNYGWPFREGTRDNSGDAQRTTPTGFASTDPIGEYTHADGIAIIGGMVYHGTQNPALDGDYLFGDLGSSKGRLFYMSANGGLIQEFNYSAGSAPVPGSLYGVSTDNAGEAYYFFSNGSILSTVPEPGGGALLLGGILPILARRRNFERQTL